MNAISLLILHHGAAEGVTGSCHRLQVSEDRALLDCGLFEGQDANHTLGRWNHMINQVLPTVTAIYQVIRATRNANNLRDDF